MLDEKITAIAFSSFKKRHHFINFIFQGRFS